MITTSIVARRGWIIPAPLAIPPTVKPPARAAASFGPESVVRIAPAAASPALGGELAGGGLRPREHLVEREAGADHARREDEHLFRGEAELTGEADCRGDGVRLALRCPSPHSRRPR